METLGSNTLAPSPARKASPTGQVGQGDRRGAWDDAPLKTKYALLVCLAAVGGALVGMVEAAMSFTVWPLAFGLTLVVCTLIWLGHQWIWGPFSRLVENLQRVKRDTSATQINKLVMPREDEVGLISQLVFDIAAGAMRTQYESRQLRRTLDDRVQQATEQATRRLRQLAMRDPLTSLGNRRFLDENLDALVESVLASDEDLICIAMDLDNFKQANDTMGHSAGDELLIFLAGILRASTRNDDYAVRLGGDEFIVLLPSCPMERATQLAQHIRTLFNQHARTALPAKLKCGMSLGVASLKESGMKNGQDLLAQADANLYAAKRNGKGQVSTGAKKS